MTRRPVGWALLAQSGLVLAGYSAVRPMASYRAIELHAGNTEIGLLSASFAVLPLLAAYPVGRQVDRFGPARVIVAGSVVFTVAGVLAATAGNLPVLLVASALLGLGQLVCVVGQQSAIALGRPERLDRGFGLLTSAGAVGQALGPLLAAFAASAVAGRPGTGGGWSSAAAGIAVGTLLGGASVLCWRPLLRTLPRPAAQSAAQSGRGSPEPTRPTTWRIARQMVGRRGMTPTLLAGGVVLGALDLLLAFLPAWAQERGVSVTTVGWLLAVRAVVTLLVRLVVDRLVRRTGRRMAMMLSIGLAGLGLALLPLVQLGGAVAIMVLLGFGLGAAQPLTMSWVADTASPTTRGAAMGLRLTANRLAQTALPVGVGAVSVSVGGVFWATGALLAVSAGVLLRLPPDRPPQPPQAQSSPPG